MPKLKKGDKFKIDDSAYRKRIFTVEKVDAKAAPTSFAFKCKNNLGDTQFFSQVNLDFYDKKIQLIKG